MIGLIFKGASLALKLKATQEAVQQIRDVLPPGVEKAIIKKGKAVADTVVEKAVDLAINHGPDSVTKSLKERFTPPPSKQQQQMDAMAKQLAEMQKTMHAEGAAPAAKKPARKTAAKKTVTPK